MDRINKNTKHTLKEGMTLDNGKYIITGLWTAGRSIYMTITDTTDKRSIYGQPMTYYYGMKIDREEA